MHPNIIKWPSIIILFDNQSYLFSYIFNNKYHRIVQESIYVSRYGHKKKKEEKKEEKITPIVPTFTFCVILIPTLSIDSIFILNFKFCINLVQLIMLIKIF